MNNFKTTESKPFPIGIMNRQEEQQFLDDLKENDWRVKIYLVNGVGLEGQIINDDDIVIIIENVYGIQQLIYKSNITTICKKITNGKKITNNYYSENEEMYD